jgi:teichuronic acid biosynthesis glycosyltransferase TuaC
MRTLFIVTDYPSSESPVAGVFHQTCAEALVRKGIDLTVVAPIPWVPPGWGFLRPKWRCYTRVPSRYELNGVAVERPRYLQLPRSDHWFPAHLAFAKVAHRFALRHHSDIIHAHYAFPCGLAAIEAGRKLGVPVMVTVHGSDVNIFPDISSRARRWFCDAILGADIVTAVGKTLADRVDVHTGRKPIHLPIGINLRRFLDAPLKQIARERLKLPPEATVVLFAGSLSPDKGVHELLGALESLRNGQILGLFVGDGPLRQKVQDATAVRSDGERPNGEMPWYMAAADLFVLPSYSEGLSTVLVEAGAVGVPILATAVGGNVELLENDFGSLVPSRSAEALAQGIRESQSDPAAARQRAERFRSHVKRHYDAERNATKLVALYERMRYRLGKQQQNSRNESTTETPGTIGDLVRMESQS